MYLPYHKIVVLFFLIISFVGIKAQEQTNGKLRLNLEQAIELALQKNKNLQIHEINTHLSELNIKDARQERFPDIELASGFGVLDNLHQYENGLGNPSTSYETPRIKYELNLEAEIPIYTGGRLKYEDQKAEVSNQISLLKYHKEVKEVKLQIIQIFLKGYLLDEQLRLMQEKIKEDSTVISLTEKLKSNGLVTYNDVLRAKLQLSNHEMDFYDYQNELSILIHELKTALSLPEEVALDLDTNNLLKAGIANGNLEVMLKTSEQYNEQILIAEQSVNINKLDQKIIKSNVLPKVSGYAKYGYNYPNFMFFPPEEHLYRFGAVGVNIKIPISNHFKNKVKTKIANKRIEQSEIQLEEQKEQLNHAIYSAQQRLWEVDKKITIAQEAIRQAEENYRIVKVKYNNQLSLITELVDADNAYLSAQTNLISLKINKQLKQYQLEYLLGNI